MTRKRHPCARTTPAMRREIRQSEDFDRALAARFGVNPKTIAKWRRRSTSSDARKGPKRPASTLLTAAEEALIVVYRRRMLFALDDCFLGLKDAIPNLSRSALHRCLKRYGLSRIPAGQAKRPRDLGPVPPSPHYTVELYALPVEMGGNYLLFAICNRKRFIFAKAVDEFLYYETADFLDDLIKRSPVKIASVETDDHEAFTDAKGRPWDAKHPSRRHPFRKACQWNEIVHLVTKSKNPAPIKVFRGWRGVTMKSQWDLYRETPTEHYRRLAKAEVGAELSLALKMALELAKERRLLDPPRARKSGSLPAP